MLFNADPSMLSVLPGRILNFEGLPAVRTPRGTLVFGRMPRDYARIAKDVTTLLEHDWIAEDLGADGAYDHSNVIVAVSFT